MDKPFTKLLVKIKNPWFFALVTLCLIVFIYQIYQSFASSSSLDMVGYRGEDDEAFHAVLRNIHQAIIYFKFGNIAKNPQYYFYYGWMFWAISAIFTMPGFIFSKFAGIDYFLIAGVSQLSLLLSFGGLFFTYKTISIYTKDELIKFLIIAFILSYPAFGYYSLKWHPSAFNFFFNAWALYLTVSLSQVTNKDLCTIAIVAALSVGCKLTGAFILPLIGLILFERMEFLLNKKTIKQLICFVVMVLLFSLLFTNPKLFILNRSIWKGQFNFSGLISANLGNLGAAEPGHRFIYGTMAFVKLPIMAILILFYGLAIRHSIKYCKNNKFDILFIFISVILILLYLTCCVHSYIEYSFVAYFFTVSFLLPYAFLCLDSIKISRSILIVFALTILLANFALNFNNLFVPYNKYEQSQNCYAQERIKCWDVSNSYLTYMHHEKYYKKYVDAGYKMRALVGNLNDYKNGLYMLMDSEVPEFYNPDFRQPNISITTVFNNINAVQNSIAPNKFDYIAFYKYERMMLQEQELLSIIKTLKQRIQNDNSLSTTQKQQIMNENEKMFDNWMDSEKIVQQFLLTKRFQGAKYKLIYEDKNFLFYKKQN